KQIKSLLGDDLIASSRAPGAAVIAPTHVESHGHPGTSGVLESGVVGCNCLVEGFVEILTSLQHLLSGTSVSQLDDITQGIELNVGHALGNQRLHLTSHDIHDILDEV